MIHLNRQTKHWVKEDLRKVWGSKGYLLSCCQIPQIGLWDHAHTRRGCLPLCLCVTVLLLTSTQISVLGLMCLSFSVLIGFNPYSCERSNSTALPLLLTKLDICVEVSHVMRVKHVFPDWLTVVFGHCWLWLIETGCKERAAPIDCFGC